MSPSRILTGLLALAATAVLAVGCTSDDSAGPQDQPLPEAGKLLDTAAETTSEITSAHVSLRVTGDVAGLKVQGLDGDLTREGGEVAAEGSGKMKVMGRLVSVKFVLSDDTLYIKGPTGGYQKIAGALSSSVYDPSALLDPERGVSNILRNATDAKTTGRESVHGTPAFTVAGTVSGKALGKLLPGVSDEADVTFWLAQSTGHRPLKAAVHFPNNNDGKTPTATVTLSNVNKPVSVTPPT